MQIALQWRSPVVKAQAILGRNCLSPELPSIASPPKCVAIWSQRSKTAIRRHTLSIAAPILKNIAFDLMINPANPVSQAAPSNLLFKYFKVLEERGGNFTVFVPGPQIPDEALPVRHLAGQALL